jgi:hypothetical protein
MVRVLAIGPKVHGFKPSRGNGLLRAIKIHSTPSFREEVRLEAPCKILWHAQNTKLLQWPHYVCDLICTFVLILSYHILTLRTSFPALIVSKRCNNYMLLKNLSQTKVTHITKTNCSSSENFHDSIFNRYAQVT